MTKNDLKYYSSLLIKKYRREENKFLVEGLKLISEAINSDYCCEILFASKESINENRNFLTLMQKNKIKVEYLNESDLSKISDTKTNQGLIAAFQFKENISNPATDQKLIVALENVSDPGNMGTIIRNCDWFGVKNIILSSECAEIFNPKVVRSSAGSVFHIGAHEAKNFYDELENRKKDGYKILCADLNGENIYSISLTEKSVLVLANEASGPTPQLVQLADVLITIPRKGNAESLNVASASAVILSELSK